MNDDRSLERAARSWLETGPTQAPDHAVEAALARIQTTTQERDLRVPWRNTSMRIQVAVAAAVALVAIGGVAAFIRLPAPPGPDATLPAASAPPSSAVPSPSPSTASQRARWHHVEQLHSPRRGTEGVVLTDGRILITGGIYRQTSNTAELFDPRTETWSLASPMREAREYPVATLLADGRVLVFSGWSGDPPTAEIYDPQDDSWASTGSMIQARSARTATLLTDGTVLVAGGMDADFRLLNTAEIYDPATGTWAATGSMTENRTYPTVTRLADGRVMVVGGSGGTGPEADTVHDLATAEIYDPVARTWTATPPLTHPRFGSTATLLPDGRVLVAGGYGGASTTPVQSSVEIFDPTTGKWVAAGEMLEPRGGASATLLADGTVLVAGGAGSGSDDQIQATVERFDPQTGAWTLAPRMSQPRYLHTAVLLPDGSVLVAGGKQTYADQAIRYAERYVP